MHEKPGQVTCPGFLRPTRSAKLKTPQKYRAGHSAPPVIFFLHSVSINTRAMMKRLAIPLLVVALAGCSYRSDIDLERDKQGWPVFFIHSGIDLGNITISMTPMQDPNGKPLWQFHNDNRVKELRLPYSTVGDFRTLPAGCYVVDINGPGMLGYSNFYVARDNNVVTMRKIGLTHLPADMQSDEDKEAVRLCGQPPKHR